MAAAAAAVHAGMSRAIAQSLIAVPTAASATPSAAPVSAAASASAPASTASASVNVPSFSSISEKQCPPRSPCDPSDSECSTDDAQQVQAVLLKVLELEEIDTNMYRGFSPPVPRWGRVYGGQTCLLSSSLVAVHNGPDIAVSNVKKGMQLIGSDTEPVTVLNEPFTGEADTMIKIDHQQGSMTVTGDHEVTLRWGADSRAITRERAGWKELHLSWFDHPTGVRQSMAWRYLENGAAGDHVSSDELTTDEKAHRRTPCLPRVLSPHVLEYAHFWLCKAEATGLVRPLRLGDLFEVPAKELAEARKNVAFANNATIPMVYTGRPVVSSLTKDPETCSASFPAAADDEDAIAATAAQVTSEIPVCDEETDGEEAGFARCAAWSAVDESSWLDEFMALKGLAGASKDTGFEAASRTVSSEREVIPSEIVAAGREIPAGASGPMKTASEHLVVFNAGADSFSYPLATGANEPADIVYMIHNPFSDQSSLVSETGKASFTIQQLERAWHAWKLEEHINTDSHGVLLCDLNSIDSRAGKFDEVCAASMAKVLAMDQPPACIIAFGALRDRWLAVYRDGIAGVAARELVLSLDGGVDSLELTTTAGATVRVLFAGHPSAWSMFDSVLTAVGRAHGLVVTDELIQGMVKPLNLFSSIGAVKEVAGGTYVGFEVSGDKRFVLSDGSLTHNCSQSLVAACRTVDPRFVVHSLHAYFLRPGDDNLPIIYYVERLRNGYSFASRRVTALQKGQAIFTQTVRSARHAHNRSEGADHTDRTGEETQHAEDRAATSTSSDASVPRKEASFPYVRRCCLPRQREHARMHRTQQRGGTLSHR